MMTGSSMKKKGSLRSNGEQTGGSDRFEGFGPQTFSFFEGLAAAQSRDWFEEHRATYERDVLAPMAAMIATLSNAFAMRGIPLTGDPKRSVFRIHRDVRFSKDKRPYKTHIGATMTRSGAKMAPGVLYMHVAPEGCFCAAGFFRPEPDVLEAIRRRLVAKPDRFREVLEQLSEAGLALGEDDEVLKRLPRGFESVDDADVSDWVRRKSLIVRRPLSSDSVFSRDIAVQIADFAGQAMPLLDFGWRAIGHEPGNAL